MEQLAAVPRACAPSVNVTDPTSQGKRSSLPRPSHEELQQHTPNTFIDEENSSKIDEPRSSTLPSESQRAEHRLMGFHYRAEMPSAAVALESKRHGPVYVGGWVPLLGVSRKRGGKGGEGLRAE